MFLVKAENLGVFRGKWILRNINLVLQSGEIVTLVGPNGGGKTTLLRSLIGILPPTEGEVRNSADLRIGYMPQSPSFNYNLPLSVAAFMRLGSNDGQLVDSILADCQAAHLKPRQLSELSGGEFQRVQFARTLLSKPNLLLLDEPTQKLDAGSEIAIYELIDKAVKKLSCGVLLVSHDLHVVMGSSDRVICINGHICCSGTPEKIASDAEYRRLLGDGGDKLMALYRHRHDHKHD